MYNFYSASSIGSSVGNAPFLLNECLQCQGRVFDAQLIHLKYPIHDFQQMFEFVVSNTRTKKSVVYNTHDTCTTRMTHAHIRPTRDGIRTNTYMHVCT